jgi:hypothetical protein
MCGDQPNAQSEEIKNFERFKSYENLTKII